MLASMSSDSDHEQVESERRRSIEPPGHAPPRVEAPEQTPVQRLAQSVGNRNFAQVVSRMRAGEGITPEGVVHPDVDAAIAANRGRGMPLDARLADAFSSKLGSLHDVRVHTGPQANALARAVDARAFVVGTDMYFADNEYTPHTPAGRELIGHELGHVLQQRNAPQTGPLRVSNPGEPLEVEADAISRDLNA